MAEFPTPHAIPRSSVANSVPAYRPPPPPRCGGRRSSSPDELDELDELDDEESDGEPSLRSRSCSPLRLRGGVDGPDASSLMGSTSRPAARREPPAPAGVAIDRTTAFPYSLRLPPNPALAAANSDATISDDSECTRLISSSKRVRVIVSSSLSASGLPHASSCTDLAWDIRSCSARRASATIAPICADSHFFSSSVIVRRLDSKLSWARHQLEVCM